MGDVKHGVAEFRKMPLFAGVEYEKETQRKAMQRCRRDRLAGSEFSDLS